MSTAALVGLGITIFAIAMLFFGVGFWAGQRQGWRDITDRPCRAAAPEAKAFDALGQFPALDDEDYIPF